MRSIAASPKTQRGFNPAAIAAGFALVGAAAVLVGWATNTAGLKSVVPGLVAMNPLTAVAFVAAGLALWLLQRADPCVLCRRAALILALCVTGVGLVGAARFLLGFDLHLDEVLFASRLDGNRMAPNTAAAFLLLGLSIAGHNVVVARIRPSDWLALFVAPGSLLTVVGYSYSASSLYGIGSFIPMALNTAILFGVLAAGTLMARPENGLVSPIFSRSAGGQIARRLIPAAILIPLSLGWLRLLGHHTGVFDSEAGVTWMVTLTIVAFVAVIYGTAHALNRADQARQAVLEALRKAVVEREQAEQTVRQLNAELDERVRKRTAELAESESRFESFMGNSPTLAFMKDEDGRMVYANRRFEELFTRDWLGKSDLELWPSPIAETLRTGDRQVLDSDHSAELLEELRLPGSESSYWLTYKFPIRDALGRRFLGGVAVDITERKRVEEALKQRDEQLLQSQKMEAIGTLAGGVAHEFNNLLQAIDGYTRYAIEGLLPDDQRFQDLEQVLKASERATTLTRQLLGFGRRQMMEFMNLDANQLVRDAVKLLRPLIGEHIKLELLLGELTGAVYADPTQLQQLLMNLCVNARDAMPSGGQLLVKSEALVLDGPYCDLHPDVQPGRYTLLSVSDEGCGIAREDLERIFEPFFTTKEVGKGTGLGLATVYGIVRQHKGTIRVYSEVGIGTTFRVYLPTCDELANIQESSLADSGATGSELILVAEDEPLVRDLAVRILEGAGYRTIVANDGVEAIDLFKARSAEISLALLDVVMPKLGGHAVYQQIKSIKPDIKAMLSSGYDPETGQLGFVKATGLRLLQKPFNPHALLSAVREVLDEESLCAL